MSGADGTIPTTVTRKRKRRSGFTYSTKRAIECSRLSKEIAKGRVLELGSVRKALTYPSELLSEIGHASLQSVDENQEERFEASIGLAFAVSECYKKVSILRYILYRLMRNVLPFLLFMDPNVE
jgi:hypothetical protein